MSVLKMKIIQTYIISPNLDSVGFGFKIHKMEDGSFIKEGDMHHLTKFTKLNEDEIRMIIKDLD